MVFVSQHVTCMIQEVLDKVSSSWLTTCSCQSPRCQDCSTATAKQHQQRPGSEAPGACGSFPSLPPRHKNQPDPPKTSLEEHVPSLVYLRSNKKVKCSPRSH